MPGIQIKSQVVQKSTEQFRLVNVGKVSPDGADNGHEPVVSDTGEEYSVLRKLHLGGWILVK